MAIVDIRDTRVDIQCCSLAAVYNIAMASLILRLRERGSMVTSTLQSSHSVNTLSYTSYVVWF
jgi:hypothetical protein